MDRIVIFIVLGIILLGIALYFILRPASPLTTTNKIGPIDLSSKTNALSISDFSTPAIANAFYKEGQGSFQCFVMLDAISRTGSHVDCGKGTATPACDTGLYPICKCTAVSDCTNCDHAGYQKLCVIHGIYTLEVMNVPDASRPNAVGAQLTVRTRTNSGGNDTTEVETIDLPPIDRQKWVMITITKEGRRIDVYYNNALVTSSTLQSIISTDSNATPLITGDPMLSGQIGGIRFLPNRMTITEVVSSYAASVDTRGQPNMFVTTPTALTYTNSTAPEKSIIQKLCLDGSCLSFPKLGQPEISEYSNIFNQNASNSRLPFTTQYA